MMAVREGKGPTVELLIARGADVNRRNQNGASALAWALRGNEQNDGSSFAPCRREGVGNTPVRAVRCWPAARLRGLAGGACSSHLLRVGDERPRQLDPVAIGKRCVAAARWPKIA